MDGTPTRRAATCEHVPVNQRIAECDDADVCAKRGIATTAGWQPPGPVGADWSGAGQVKVARSGAEKIRLLHYAKRTEEALL